jgi:hypothetical protein
MAPRGLHVSRVQWGLVAACIVVLAAGIFFVSSEPDDVTVRDVPTNSMAAAPQFDRLLGREFAPVDLSVQRNDQSVTLTEIASSNPKVHIYALN